MVRKCLWLCMCLCVWCGYIQRAGGLTRAVHAIEGASWADAGWVVFAPLLIHIACHAFWMGLWCWKFDPDTHTHTHTNMGTTHTHTNTSVPIYRNTGREREKEGVGTVSEQRRYFPWSQHKHEEMKHEIGMRVPSCYKSVSSCEYTKCPQKGTGKATCISSCKAMTF